MLIFVAVAAEKHRGWQTGIVLDPQQSQYFPTNSPETQTNGRDVTFIIQGETYVYLVQQRLRWNWSKAANLTVKMPVKFTTDERRVLFRGDDGKKHETQWHKFFVIDNHGKEHEMEIVKKLRKQRDPASSSP